jgi:hypothetical protein
MSTAAAEPSYVSMLHRAKCTLHGFYCDVNNGAHYVGIIDWGTTIDAACPAPLLTADDRRACVAAVHRALRVPDGSDEPWCYIDCSHPQTDIFCVPFGRRQHIPAMINVLVQRCGLRIMLMTQLRPIYVQRNDDAGNATADGDGVVSFSMERSERLAIAMLRTKPPANLSPLLRHASLWCTPEGRAFAAELSGAATFAEPQRFAAAEQQQQQSPIDYPLIIVM